MSEQPIPCKMEGNCTEYTIAENCNPTCDFYNPIDEHIPEDVQKQLDKEEIIKKSNPILEFSSLLKFDKTHEFIVLKKHVFQMQSISPKKIILKFKRKLNEKDAISDGCYTFKDQNMKLLNPMKVFRKMDMNAKKKHDEEN